MCQEVVVSNAKSFLPENVVAMLLFLTKNICRLEITPLKRDIFVVAFWGVGSIIVFCFVFFENDTRLMLKVVALLLVTLVYG